MVIMLKKEVKRKKKFKSRFRLWKLKDIVVRAAFKENVDSKDNGTEDWVKLKTNLLDVGKKVIMKEIEGATASQKRLLRV